MSEIVAYDGETRLLVLQGARVFADRIYTRQEHEISLGRRRLPEDVLKTAPGGEGDEHAGDKQQEAREEVADSEDFCRGGEVNVVDEHEERQRADVDPEAVGADRGKAQKNLLEERPHDGQDS